MENTRKEKFKELLDNKYDWPDSYLFKFIVPHHREEELKEVVGEADFSRKPSRTGKYVSITLSKEVTCSDDVLEVYEKVSVIEGVVSL